MSNEFFINKYTLGMTSTNCYLLSGRYLVDPGGINESLRADLEEYADQIETILLTHAHYDHIGGINAVRDVIGDCPVVCHAGDEEMLGDPEKNMSTWTGETVSFRADWTYEEGSGLEVNDSALEVIHTPGHTPGSVSLFLEDEDVLLAGDTLFKQGIGRTDLPGGNHQQLLESIRQEILTLPRGTRVLPGHGPETTVGSEAHDNPFLN